MTKIRMDATEVATSIHKGDFSKLRGKSFEMCDNLGMGKKYTLNQIGDDLAKLTKYVTEGFKQVNERIDKIDIRLDYIVKANDLKDLPKNSK